MYSPDATNRVNNFDPTEEGDYAHAQEAVKPVEGNRPARDFKKVFNKTERQGKKGSDAIKQGFKSVADEEQQSQTAGVIGGKRKSDLDDASEASNVSLFDLSRQSGNVKGSGKEGGGGSRGR